MTKIRESFPNKSSSSSSSSVSSSSLDSVDIKWAGDSVVPFPTAGCAVLAVDLSGTLIMMGMYTEDRDPVSVDDAEFALDGVVMLLLLLLVLADVVMATGVGFGLAPDELF